MGCYISQDVKNIMEKLRKDRKNLKIEYLQKDVSDKMQKKIKSDYTLP